jgi:exodeoxyribonuclease VII large subunit
MPLDERSYLTVSEINAQVRSLVEDAYPEVTVLGEISNFKRHTSGHLYFTLKDADAQLRSACFRANASRIGFDVEDGMRVLATGRITLYEPYGQYQLVVYRMEKAGVGELEIAFRELCERLEKEGLFNPDHKVDLPVYPFRIAVVTSPTGAAVRDIITTLRRRWPAATVLLYPVAVQGEGSAEEIAGAIEAISEMDDIDLVIMGRGGGSLEDLWSFNEEAVARAVFECPIPVISAVGHETDFTITDFVADLRAPTPTAAAEIATPRADEVKARLTEIKSRLARHFEVNLELKRRRLDEMLRSYALGRVRGQVESAMQALDYATDRLRRLGVDAVRTRGTRLREALTRLDGLDTRRILSRGFSIVTERETGAVVRSRETALDMRDISITFADGKVDAEVKEGRDGR